MGKRYYIEIPASLSAVAESLHDQILQVEIKVFDTTTFQSYASKGEIKPTDITYTDKHGNIKKK